MKHIFVYNPAAGQHFGGALDDLRAKLKEYDGRIDYEIYVTTGKGDATAFVKRRADEEPDTALRFYACGGDGTANEVLHGVIGHTNASMTCYPCGSGNDFVKYYGGADSFLDLDALIAGAETEIDVMRIDDRYSMNVTNFGFDTAVVKTMERVRHKKLLGGNNAYTTGIVTALLRSMRTACTVEVDGEAINDGECLLCTVSNGRYVGGSFCCAPRSVNDDGLLEVCLVRPLSRLTFFQLIGRYKKGTLLDNPKYRKYITYRRGKSIHVHAPEGFSFCLDGELIEKNDFTIEVCPKALRFAVPATKSPAKAEEKEPATV
ncbi:MAG: diacylglycerol kinase family lipid kinase [Clostridia bacterium]|nr:diacylglycerol kinase family lipid kinase [Clostridia bacterium]